MEQPSTVSADPAEPDERSAAGPSVPWAPPVWAVLVAGALAVGTLAHLGLSADGVAWAAVQVVLVGVAAFDLARRRVKNAVTVPVSLLALLLRVVFERSAFAEVLITGAIAFLVFFALATVLRGGLGMGDVKLAAMLGFLLGEDVLPALFVGTIVGGIAAALLLARSGTKRTTMAYGPYLALGGALAILFERPPHLL